MKSKVDSAECRIAQFPGPWRYVKRLSELFILQLNLASSYPYWYS